MYQMRLCRDLDTVARVRHRAEVTSGATWIQRYVGWIERQRWAIVAASIAFVVIAASLASELTVVADFSYLVPQSAKSVQDLRAIGKRARVLGSAMIVVESDDHDARRRAAIALRDKILALGTGEVSSVTFDHGVEHRYAWDHRWLFADLADLVAARDGLAAEIADAKLAANPLYVPLDDPDPASAQAPAAPTRCARSCATRRPRATSRASWSAPMAACR